MDNDNLCSKRTQQEIESLIDLAITDIFNSKKHTGKIANPSDESSLIDIIKSKWIKYDSVHKEQLTKQLKVLSESKSDYCKLATNREILYYFTHYILPYSKESISSTEKRDKNLISALSWSNSVVDKLKNIQNIEDKIDNCRKKEIIFQKCQEEYCSNINEFFSLYGNPSKKDLLILKLKLMFSNESELFKHLLREKKDLQSIMNYRQTKNNDRSVKA